VILWHFSVIELLWSVIGLLLISVSWTNVRDSATAADKIEASGRDGPLLELSRVRLRADIARLIRGATVLAIGITAGVAVPSTPQPVTPVGAAVTMGLFLFVINDLVVQWLDSRYRKNH
jgi:hypothetical protein